MRAVLNGKPDLKRCLRPDAMQAQCRKEANHSQWHTQRHFRKRPVLANGPPRQSINPSCKSIELACCNQSAQHNGWQLLLRKIPGAQQRSCPGKFQDSMLMR